MALSAARDRDQGIFGTAEAVKLRDMVYRMSPDILYSFVFSNHSLPQTIGKTYLRGFRACARTPFRNSVPQGRLNLAQDASPGLDFERLPSPAGTAENRPRRNPGQLSAVPAGLNHVA